MLAFKCLLCVLRSNFPLVFAKYLPEKFVDMNSNVPLIHKPWKSIGKLWKIDKSQQSGQFFGWILHVRTILLVKSLWKA